LVPLMVLERLNPSTAQAMFGSARGGTRIVIQVPPQIA
jgi:hypothetical protein